MTSWPCPDQWMVVPISALGRVVTGSTPPTSDHSLYGGTIPFVRPQELLSTRVGRTMTTLTEAGARAGRTVPEGSVLVGCIGTIGKSAWTETRVAFNQQINAVVPYTPTMARWLFYGMQSPTFMSAMHANSSATTVAIINKGRFSSLSLPVAPDPEQHRIVAAIETQFTRLDFAVATLERVRANLKRARASILKAAVEGRLVPTEASLARAEGRPYEPASVLLTRILDERKARWPKGKKYVPPAEPEAGGLPHVPEGWTWATVGQLFDQRLGKMLDKAKNVGTLRPYLRNINVRWFSFDLSDVKEMRVEDRELDAVSVRNGDLVVCEGGEPGRCAVWTSSAAGFVIQKACHRLRPQGRLSSHFFSFVLASEVSAGRLKKEFTGSTIQHLTGESLVPFTVPLPPVAEQVRIVAEVERRLSLLDKLNDTVELNLVRCTRLRQSILKRAFEGKLVPQNPDDEPANVLLDRIQSQVSSVV